jgi:hypothetical protein
VIIRKRSRKFKLDSEDFLKKMKKKRDKCFAVCYWMLNDFSLPVAHEYKNIINHDLPNIIRMAESKSCRRVCKAA